MMLQWVYRIADRVDALAAKDTEYRELDRRRKELDVTGNMQYRLTQLAWLYGKLHPHD